MPELLDGLVQLGDSEDPEQQVTVARATCKFIEILSFYWDAVLRRLHGGGFPAKLFRSECDKLLGMGETPARFLDRFTEKWREWEMPAEDATHVYKEVQSARQGLNALMTVIRQAREQAPVSSGISAAPEQLRRRIREADEKGEWRRRPAAASGQQNGPATDKE